MVLKPNIVFLKMNLQFIFQLILKCDIISYVHLFNLKSILNCFIQTMVMSGDVLMSLF